MISQGERGAWPTVKYVLNWLISSDGRSGYETDWELSESPSRCKPMNSLTDVLEGIFDCELYLTLLSQPGQALHTEQSLRVHYTSTSWARCTLGQSPIFPSLCGRAHADIVRAVRVM
jgi:hypothetical protein